MIIDNSTIAKNNFIYSPKPVALKTPEKEDNDRVTLSGDSMKPESEYSFQINPQYANNNSKIIGIVHTNDEHDNTFKKFPREATIVKEREQVYGDENSFIINLGDITYNGNNKAKDKHFFGPAADILNSMGVEFFVPGNHDLDHGTGFLEDKILSTLHSTNLLGNVTYKSGEFLDNTKPYKIEEVNGVKIGFVGVTTPKSHGEDDKEDFTVSPIMESLEELVPQMKNDGAEITVVLMHEGINTAKVMAQSIPGIDIIIAGHDHKVSCEEVENPDGKNTVVVEAGGNVNYVGDMAIEVDPSSKKIISINYKLFSTSGVEPDPEVRDIINKYKNN